MEDKVVLITGASSGIGAGTAKHLSKIGYKKFCIVSRTKRNLETVSQECKKLGAKDVLILDKDLSDLDANKEIVDKLVQHFGRLDVLINNAAYAKTGTEPFKDMSKEELVKSTTVNFMSPLLLMKYALPHLEKTKGSIVNISSVANERFFAIHSPYGATKSALSHQTRIVALEEASKGVRVNSISPGMICTEAFLNSSTDTFDDVRKRMADMQPLGRMGEPLEMSKLIAFMISDDNKFMTGSEVKSDGGISLNH